MNLINRIIIFSLLSIFIALPYSLEAQINTPNKYFFAFISNSKFEGIENVHIVNLNSREITISDTLGYFKLTAKDGDYLLIKNIAYHDTIVKVLDTNVGRNIIIRQKYNLIKELKVFPWGNGYEDFKEAIINMPSEQPLAERLGLPIQDPNYIPFYMDEEALRNPLYLFASPVSYLYYRFSRFERINRKAYQYGKNKSKQEYMNILLSKKRVMEISQCSEDEFENFISYLNQNFNCDFNCSELEILSEIYYWWQEYKAKAEKKN